jgi:hypothetical protein
MCIKFRVGIKTLSWVWMETERPASVARVSDLAGCIGLGTSVPLVLPPRGAAAHCHPSHVSPYTYQHDRSHESITSRFKLCMRPNCTLTRTPYPSRTDALMFIGLLLWTITRGKLFFNFFIYFNVREKGFIWSQNRNL